MVGENWGVLVSPGNEIGAIRREENRSVGDDGWMAGRKVLGCPDLPW